MFFLGEKQGSNKNQLQGKRVGWGEREKRVTFLHFGVCELTSIPLHFQLGSMEDVCSKRMDTWMKWFNGWAARVIGWRKIFFWKEDAAAKSEEGLL